MPHRTIEALWDSQTPVPERVQVALDRIRELDPEVAALLEWTLATHVLTYFMLKAGSVDSTRSTWGPDHDRVRFGKLRDEVFHIDVRRPWGDDAFYHHPVLGPLSTDPAFDEEELRNWVIHGKLPDRFPYVPREAAR